MIRLILNNKQTASNVIDIDLNIAVETVRKEIIKTLNGKFPFHIEYNDHMVIIPFTLLKHCTITIIDKEKTNE
jgi:hypothetical protein